MPFRVSWEPGAGAVTVIVETARDALAVAEDYQAEGRGEIVLTTLDGAALSVADLVALAAADPANGLGV